MCGFSTFTKLSLFFKHHAMELYGKVEIKLHTFLTLAVVGDEWTASHFDHFISGEISSYTRCY